MALFSQLLVGHFLAFTLVLTRVSGMAISAPLFGSAEIPLRIRALLAICLALLVAPLQFGAPLPQVENTLEYLVLFAMEGLTGMVLGLGIGLMFLGVQLAGQVVAQTSGMQLADVFNPSMDASIPIFSELFHYLALAVFVVIGGHRMMVDGLLETYAYLPIGASLSESAVETLLSLVTQSFGLAIRVAAPTMTALLLATVILGLLSRTIPQLNVMALGFGLNAAVTLIALAISLAGAAWVFQEYLESAWDTITTTLGP